MLLSVSNRKDYSTDDAVEHMHLRNSLATIRRGRVALRVQEQLGRNFEIANEGLEQAKRNLQKLQTEALSAINALQDAGTENLNENYQAAKNALELLEVEAGEALIILDWHREAKRLFDYSRGQTELT